MELNDILAVALKAGASDIHLKAGLPPMLRVDGSLVPLKDAPRLPPEEVARLSLGIMNAGQREKFKAELEIDLAYGVPGLGRFRVNVFMQRGVAGAVLRVIPFKILSIDQLCLPKVLERIALEERGMILVTGTTGSGKSTTLAAMIDHVNSLQTCHILTVEDPVEFMIRDKRSVVNQREVGVDTSSFSRALKSALREDPDVILVGEMRDLETIEMAMTAAETGHLVMSTLHTMDATETINRIVNVFPPFQQKQVRITLASSLRAIIAQRLVPRADGRGRIAAMEIMVSTARTRELIEDKDRTKELHDAIGQGGTSYGMQTFDQHLMQLVHQRMITYEEALRQATNPDDFALKFSGVSGTSDQSWGDFDINQVSRQAAAPRAPAPPPPPPPPAPAMSAAPGGMPAYTRPTTLPPAPPPPLTTPAPGRSPSGPMGPATGAYPPPTGTYPPPMAAPRPPSISGTVPPYLSAASAPRGVPTMPPAQPPASVRPAAAPAAPAGAAASGSGNPDDEFVIERF